jgi:hypothetical protein
MRGVLLSALFIVQRYGFISFLPNLFPEYRPRVRKDEKNDTTIGENVYFCSL